MADTFSKEKRSLIMSRVKSSHNKSTELKLIDFFKRHSIIGWRRNYNLFGKPDFVFPRLRKVVFVDGCFWHGHDCRNTKPIANKDYWDQKILKNTQRDVLVSNRLISRGWIVIRIWECELKSEKIIMEKISNSA